MRAGGPKRSETGLRASAGSAASIFGKVGKLLADNQDNLNSSRSYVRLLISWQDAALDGIANQFLLIADAEFAHQIHAIAFDGAWTDEESF